MSNEQEIKEHKNGITTALPQQSRRQLLRSIATFIGSTALAQLASGNALAVALAYEAKADSAQKAGRLFTLQQMTLLADVCAAVLPKTDTPSGAELDVHGFIDHQLIVCYSDDKQKQAVQIVETIDRQSYHNYAKSFHQLNIEHQTELLIALEEQRLGFSSKDELQFKALKSLLVFGYFTTEVGATKALSYQAIPGGFKGSVPYDSVGKSYGSLAYY